MMSGHTRFQKIVWRKNKMRKLKIIMMMVAMLFLCACGKNDELNMKNDTENESLKEQNIEESSELSSEATQEEDSTEVKDLVVQESVANEVIETPAIVYTYKEFSKTMYAKSAVNVRDLPSTDGNKLGALTKAQEVSVTGQCNETSWYRITYNGVVAYVSNNYLVETKPEEEKQDSTWFDEDGFHYTITSSRTFYADWAGKMVTWYTGYAVAPNTGFSIIIDDEPVTIAVNEKSKAVANAGYYEPVKISIDYGDNIERAEFCMLIENPEDEVKWFQWLEEYIQAMNWLPGSRGIDWAEIEDNNGNKVYTISMRGEELQY